MANRGHHVNTDTLEKYMVVEKFHTGAQEKIYQRFKQHGRKLPEGLYYIDSWLSADANICFQLMATENKALFDEWITHWSDLTDFDIFPIDKKPD